MIGLHESLSRDQADILDLAIKRLREKGQSKAVFYLLQIRQNGDVLE